MPSVAPHSEPTLDQVGDTVGVTLDGGDGPILAASFLGQLRAFRLPRAVLTLASSRNRRHCRPWGILLLQLSPLHTLPPSSRPPLVLLSVAQVARNKRAFLSELLRRLVVQISYSISLMAVPGIKKNAIASTAHFPISESFDHIGSLRVSVSVSALHKSQVTKPPSVESGSR